MNFWQALICDFITLATLGQNTSSHDSFIMAIMVHITGQVRMLNFRLEKCHMESLKLKDDEDDGDFPDTHFECFERDIGDTLDPHEELINCIKYHQHILK